MYTDLFGIYDGEILTVQSNETSGTKPNIIRYLCRVQLTNDSEILVPNVIAPTMFGGISDYLQVRNRASEDSGQAYTIDSSDAKNAAHIGARVGIMFLGGHQARPIITCFLPHPNQTAELTSPQDIKTPKLIFQFNGMRVEIDETGQFKFAHKGAPEVKYVPRSGDGLTAQLSLPGSSTIPGDDNQALTPAEDTEYTTLEFLDGGAFRVRDAVGQVIEMNRGDGLLKISNGLAPSTDPEATKDITDSEFILLDQNNKKIQIGGRELISLDAKKDRTETVGGNFKRTLSGNDEESISGDKKAEITGSWKINVKSGSFELDASKAKIKAGSGKVGMGGPGGELLDLVTQFMTEFDKDLQNIQQITVIGNLGFSSSPPVNVAAFTASQAVLAQIKAKLTSITGGI